MTRIDDASFLNLTQINFKDLFSNWYGGNIRVDVEVKLQRRWRAFQNSIISILAVFFAY